MERIRMKEKNRFFSNTRPGKTVTWGSATFELPILYYRDDLFGLYFTGDAKKIRELMPSDQMHPILLPNGRAIVAIFAFNYMETSIGAYGEIPVGIPVVYGKKTTPFTGWLPALLESSYPGFGVCVMHLPVTKATARDAGRGEWGYSKFVADMDFQITPEQLSCSMHENDAHILDINVMRRGIHIKDNKPLTTYSVKNHQLIKTVIPQQGVKRVSLLTHGSCVTLGNHPVADSIRALDISETPFMSVYYPERGGILPSGKIIETGVRAFDGYMSELEEARHTVSYGG